MFGRATAQRVREPAVAGMFYPGSAGELVSALERALASAPTGPTPVAGIIVPHAGYPFSGDTAAAGLVSLQGQPVDRILLIGPSHRLGFSGASLPSPEIEAFRTPLGDMPLDCEALALLRERPGFDGPPQAHDGEHCLEVEVPFLQRVAPEAKVAPILIGAGTGRAGLRTLADGLEGLLDDRTVVVASTDFSHHGPNYGWAPFAGLDDPQSALLDLARKTAERAAELDQLGFWCQVESSGDTVCGKATVALLLELLGDRFEGRGRVVDVTTSAKRTGDTTNSVSYVAAVFSGRWTAPGRNGGQAPSSPSPLAAHERGAIAGLARAILATHLGHGPEVAEWFGAHGDLAALRAPAGAFVTLKRRQDGHSRGRLRACMGVMDADRPLVESLMEAARSAARDPRFEPLQHDELEELDVEVSVLSPARPVSGPDDIEVGTHGVVLNRSGRRAVFLPHVAVEQGWDREEMLTALAVKAGLAGDAWRRDASFEVFTAEECHEE